ncbi:hypothetical protein NFJ02_28g65420 [Pycnococcus provasolii]
MNKSLTCSKETHHRSQCAPERIAGNRELRQPENYARSRTSQRSRSSGPSGRTSSKFSSRFSAAMASASSSMSTPTT